MRENDDAGVRIAQLADVFGREELVHFAAALPGDDFDVRVRCDIACEIFVGKQDHAVDARDSTTSMALDDVQQISLSAFTSAVVLT